MSYCLTIFYLFVKNTGCQLLFILFNIEFCFELQLPCRTGPQTTHSRINVEQNKSCLIQISRYRFSLVISGLTKVLQRVNESVSVIYIERINVVLCFSVVRSHHDSVK